MLAKENSKEKYFQNLMIIKTSPIIKVLVFLFWLLLNENIDRNQIQKYKEIADDFYKNNIDVISHGVKLNRSINESIIRYFYGAVPKKKSKIKNLDQLIKRAIIL